MKNSMVIGILLFFLLGLLGVDQSNAIPILYTARTGFISSTGIVITDDYENPAYMPVMSDAEMSAVFNQTYYYVNFAWF